MSSYSSDASSSDIPSTPSSPDSFVESLIFTPPDYYPFSPDCETSRPKQMMLRKKFRRCMRDLMRIFIYLHDDQNNRFKYCVRVDEPLKTIFNAYCRTMDVKRPDVRFIYNGSRIYGNQTAFQLNIGYKDIIEVYPLMSGGIQYLFSPV